MRYVITMESSVALLNLYRLMGDNLLAYLST